KTGTAENPKGSAHRWFMGYIENSGGEPLYSVAVVFENPESAVSAAQTAGNVMRKAVELMGE
ncbi:MAG: penicillin-binding protein 2, partial [Firmicutes bacterium]|nr:penicillin-binding protein 2 [Bacillota bacterium]